MYYNPKDVNYVYGWWRSPWRIQQRDTLEIIKGKKFLQAAMDEVNAMDCVE